MNEDGLIECRASVRDKRIRRVFFLLIREKRRTTRRRRAAFKKKSPKKNKGSFFVVFPNDDAGVMREPADADEAAAGIEAVALELSGFERHHDFLRKGINLLSKKDDAH